MIYGVECRCIPVDDFDLEVSRVDCLGLTAWASSLVVGAVHGTNCVVFLRMDDDRAALARRGLIQSNTSTCC